jgi:glucan phosphoethanolaminetransferase (alkaline phosphatase superfamily)
MRWLGLAGFVVGSAVAFAAAWMSWLGADVPLDNIEGFEAPLTMTLTSWFAFAIVLISIGMSFAMIVGARRSYMPRIAWFVAALAASGGSVLAVAAMVLVRTPMHDALGVRYVPYEHIYGGWDRYDETHPLHLTNAPYIELAGFVFAAATAWWLWSIANRITRATAMELARLDREQAIRDGDIGIEALPIVEEPVPKL